MLIATDTGMLAQAYLVIRARSEGLVAGVPVGDRNAQSMPDASPIKWHLAHTSWFFDAFVLESAGHAVGDERWRYLFNSYYRGLGDRYPRHRRGLMLRPLDAEVAAYRAAVDEAILDLLTDADPHQRELIELGLHHEQQHQELILTDLKHAYATQLPPPALDPIPLDHADPADAPTWHAHPGGVVDIGHDGTGFSYDNERSRHSQMLTPHRLADRVVTCGEYLEFIADGGYLRSDLWLDEGWDAVEAQRWAAPLYWRRDRDGWIEYTLHGERRLDPHAPLVHVSFFEADAYARWAGARLPSEAEWEVGTPDPPPEHEPGILHPIDPAQPYGTCWQWTASPYLAYPGYRPAPGAVGEYNGKFMSGKQVLRGSSVATPPGHTRRTYRNFFPPCARWQFAGIRLCEDI